MLLIQKNKSIKIAITLICTVLGVFMPNTFLWVLAAINVLTIGIIHGANDLFILSIASKTVKKHQFSYLFLSYVFFVLVMVLALQSVPQWAILLFVLVSAYHFGEQQWHTSQIVNAPKIYLFYAVYGVFLFALLFYTHIDQTIAVINELTAITLKVQLFQLLLIISSVLSIFLIFLNFIQLKSQLLFQFFALLAIALLFTQTSLLWSFSVYFVLWHSLPSLKAQALELFPDKPKPITSYLKLALPYWILAMIGFTLALLYYKDNSDTLLAVFFSFLAAITIPHVFVIFRMYQKK